MEVADKFIFDAYLNDFTPKMEVKRMKSFHTTSEGMLLRNGRMLFEGSPYFFQRDHPVYINTVKNDLFQKHIKRLIKYYFLYPSTIIKIPSVWVMDLYSHFYYHWVAETLPRIFLWDSLDTENRAIIIPKKYLNLSYIKDSLDFFPLRNFIFLDDKKLYKFKNSFFVSPMGKPYQFNPELMKAFSTFILSKLSLPDTSAGNNNRKIYISRNKARKRKLLNEAEVKSVLSQFGFEVFYMETLSLKEQIILSNESSVIAGLHGGGLANTIFSKCNSCLIELQRYLQWPSCYFRLANALDRKYHYLFCKHSPEENPSENADIIVDLAKLLALLYSI